MIIKNPLYVKMGTDVGDTTATAADVLAGKEFYLADGTKSTGQIVTYAGTKNVTPIEQAQTLPTQGKYVDGDITVDAIPSRYKDTTGTDAVAGDMLAGKTAVTGAGLVTGSIQTYSGGTSIIPTEQSQNFATSGKYVGSNLTVGAIPSAYKDTTGTDATAGDILSGKKAVTGSGMVTGSIPAYSGASTVTQNGILGVGGKYVEQDIEVAVPATPAAPVSKSDVNFYDYDGTLVAAYTAADFSNLTAMPANPSHTGLVAEGWNWTLADAKTYVASYGKLNIGQIYHTASGKTEYDIEVNEETGFTATLGLSGTEKDWGDGTIDTLESHTYTAAGNYTIKLSGTTFPSIRNSRKVRAVRIAIGVTGISSSVFSACRSLQSVTIPSSVTSIGSEAFVACYSLQSVTIPSSVTSIGSYAISACYSLQSVTIPSSVTSISIMAFNYCYSLQFVTISSRVTSISSSVFDNCRSLRSVTIPSSVTSISPSAFNYCYSLQSVTISSSVTSIGSGAFNNCPWLTIVTVLATTPPTVASSSFPSNVTKIYIPNGTLATYTAATNWSTYASKLVELPA